MMPEHIDATEREISEAIGVIEGAAEQVMEEYGLEPIDAVLLLRSISQISMYGIAAKREEWHRPRNVIQGELDEHHGWAFRMKQLVDDAEPGEFWWYPDE